MSVTYSNKLSNLSSQSALPFARRLDTVGNGTGVSNAIGDYSGTPTRFRLIPAAGELIIVNELHIYIEDGGPLDAGTYGNGLVLTNGIAVELKQGLVTRNIQGTNPILNNSHWTRVTFNTASMVFGGGNNALAYRWDLKNMYVPLALSSNDELAIILNDNFTGLVSHSFSARGFQFVS